VRALKTFLLEVLEMRSSFGEQGAAHVLAALRELSSDDLSRLDAALSCLPCPQDSMEVLTAKALDWALGLFEVLFQQDVAKLVAQHPLDSKDEEGQPFWGGSRRFPRTIAKFDPRDPLHADWARWSAWLFVKVYGHSSASEAKVRAFCSDEALSRAVLKRDAAAVSAVSKSASSCSAEQLLAKLDALLVPARGAPLLVLQAMPVDEWQVGVGV